MKASELLERAIGTLKASPAIDHWQKDREQIEAEHLLMHVMGEEPPDPDGEIPTAARRRFERLISRRATGVPIAFLKGYADFRRVRIMTKRGVFVPRDSTEFLAEQAVRRLRGRRSPVMIDLATGSGAVALAVADEVPRARVFGADLSREAAELARRNAALLRLRGCAFVAGDLFAPLPANLRGMVDVITLHPPYVAKREMRQLPEEIRRFEPRHTLTDGSANGLGLVQRTAAEAPEWLRPGGWLLIEVSPDRARGVAAVLRRAGYRDVRSTVDPTWKITRVVVGRT